MAWQGWIAFYIDMVEGALDRVDPWVKPLAPGAKRIRWSQQFLQGRQNCSSDNCREQPAFGAYRRGVYGDQVRPGLLSLRECSPFHRLTPWHRSEPIYS